MTTIAFKDGLLATDSRLTAGNEILGTIKKIQIVGDDVIAGSGANAAIETFIKFYQDLPYDKEILKDKNNTCEILVFKKATKQVIGYDEDFIPYEYEAPFYAIGSGRGFAIGAMAAGALPTEAVVIASEYDKSTDNKIQTLKIW